MEVSIVSMGRSYGAGNINFVGDYDIKPKNNINKYIYPSDMIDDLTLLQERRRKIKDKVTEKLAQLEELNKRKNALEKDIYSDLTELFSIGCNEVIVTASYSKGFEDCLYRRKGLIADTDYLRGYVDCAKLLLNIGIK